MNHSPSLSSQREDILAELSSIISIERGTLAEEYRERPAPGDKGTIRKGPYFKHQCWEDKRNRSRRVPADEVPVLRQHLENGQRFDQLFSDLAALAIANGRELRAARSRDEDDLESKKKSSRKASGKDTAKPKRSSRKSRRVSPRKGSGS